MLIFLIGFTACIDEIPLEVPEGNNRKVVIQGNIVSTSPAIIEVNVSKSADFVNFFNAEQISGAAVYILDESDRRIIIPERQPGVYQIEWINNTTFEIAQGNSYRLQVEMPDGQTYISDSDRINGVPEATKIHLDLDKRDILNETENIVETTFMQFSMETSLQHPGEEEKAYLKWDMQGVFRMRELLPPMPGSGPTSCFISEEVALGSINIFNGFETSVSAVERQLIFEDEIDWRYSDGYFLTVYQQSLSKGAYEYWEQVKEVTERDGSLFESPPGRIPSNIHNIDDENEQVLGYFYCTEVDTIRKFILPSDAGFPQDRCNSFNYSDPDTPEFCRDCTLWPNSSTVKPEFWVE